MKRKKIGILIQFACFSRVKIWFEIRIWHFTTLHERNRNVTRNWGTQDHIIWTHHSHNYHAFGLVKFGFRWNKLAKARKMRKPQGTLSFKKSLGWVTFGSKEVGIKLLAFLQYTFRKYTFRKYTFENYTFGKYTFGKYTFGKYTFGKYTFGKYIFGK